MKLIIDIPDKAYEIFLKEQCFPVGIDIEYFIMHGTPYESEVKGDLISREALKEQFGYTDEWYKSRTVTQIINNAPTVDKGYQEGHIDGMLQAEKLYARPTGKWEYNSFADAWRCNQCFQSNNKKTYFCPNCGADMRGGAENV